VSRLFWFSLGAAAGIAVSRKMAAAARQATPAGVAANVGDAIRELAGAIGAFGAEVRAGMSERERELYGVVEQQTGVTPLGAREVWTPRAIEPVRRSDRVEGTHRRAARTSGGRARRAEG